MKLTNGYSYAQTFLWFLFSVVKDDTPVSRIIPCTTQREGEIWILDQRHLANRNELSEEDQLFQASWELTIWRLIHIALSMKRPVAVVKSVAKSILWMLTMQS